MSRAHTRLPASPAQRARSLGVLVVLVVLAGCLALGCVEPALEGRRCDDSDDCVLGFRCATGICTPLAQNPPVARLRTAECPRFIGEDAAGPIDEALLTDAESVIVIGSILPLTRGGVADVVIEAREAAIALGLTEINRNGGAGGRRIVALSCNSDADVDVGLRAAAHLAAAGISVVVGEQSSARTLQLAQGALLPAGVLTIAPSATSVDLTTVDDDGLLLRTTVSDASQGELLGELLTDLDAQRVAVLAADDSYGVTLTEEFQQVFCRESACADDGVFLVTRFDAGFTDVDLDDSELEAIVAQAPDSIVVIGEVAQVKALLGLVAPAVPGARLIVTDTARRDELLAAPEPLPFEVVVRVVGTAPTPTVGVAADLLRAALLPEHRDASFVANAYDAAVVAGLLYATTPAAELHPTGRNLVAGVVRLTSVADGAPTVLTIGARDGVRDVARAIEALQGGDDVNLDGVSGPLDFDDNGDVSGDLELWRVCADRGADQLTSLGTALAADGSFTSLELGCSCLLPQLQCTAGQACLRRFETRPEACFVPCGTLGAACTTASSVEGTCATIAGSLACLGRVDQYEPCGLDVSCTDGTCVFFRFTDVGQCQRLCGTGTLCPTLSPDVAAILCGCDDGDDCSVNAVGFSDGQELMCTVPTEEGASCSLVPPTRTLCSEPLRCVEGRCTAP